MTRARRLPAPVPSPTTWIVDPRRTRVTFSVCLLGLTIVEGRFHDLSGSASFDPDRPSAAATGVARIGVDSIDTGDAELDATHRGPGVFDAATFPDILLVTRSITPMDGGRFRMVGDVTIRDVTRAVGFDIRYGGVRTDRRGVRRAAMTMTGSVDRGDFGLTRSMIFRRLAGTRVDLRIEVELREAVEGGMVAHRAMGAREAVRERVSPRPR